MMKNILVPLDGSENSQKALSQAIEIAQKFDASIVLLNVVDSTRAFGGSSAAVYHEMQTSLTDNGKKILAKAKTQVEKAGVPVTAVQADGPSKAEIATTIPVKYDVDTIVMGKTGTDALSRLLLGSTTAYVVRKAEATVVVVGA